MSFRTGAANLQFRCQVVPAACVWGTRRIREGAESKVANWAESTRKGTGSRVADQAGSNVEQQAGQGKGIGVAFGECRAR